MSDLTMIVSGGLSLVTEFLSADEEMVLLGDLRCLI